MAFDPEVHHRRSVRLRNYDYAQAGAYFATVCTHNRRCLFGDMVDSAMVLNDAGLLVDSIWHDLPTHYANLTLDRFVVMPNHLHGILLITNPAVGAQFIAPNDAGNVNQGAINRAPTKPITLSEIIRGFKARCSHAINKIRDIQSEPLWQRNYHEHVIRNENDLSGIREYIVNNPVQWMLDEENPDYLSSANTHA